MFSKDEGAVIRHCRGKAGAACSYDAIIRRCGANSMTDKRDLEQLLEQCASER